MPAHASIQEIHVVAAGVDESSHAAAAKAIDYARKRAVYIALRKLGVKDASNLAAKLTEEDYALIVRGQDVVQSRRDGNITYAEVNVTIVEEALAKILKLPPNPDGSLPTAQSKVRGIMVLPVYVGATRPYLWEKENQLRAPLADELRRQAHGGVLLPGGDYDDLRLIDYQNALTVKAEELDPMFKRYGAEEIIIAVMTPGTPGTTNPSSVLLRRLRPTDSRNEVLDVPPDSPEETAATRLDKTVVAIASAVTQIATSTSENELTVRDKAQKISVRFAYVTPKDFARMQEIVRSAPQVLQLELPAITLSRVNGTIYLQGDQKALRQDLVKKGIIVTDVSGGWRLSTR